MPEVMVWAIEHVSPDDLKWLHDIGMKKVFATLPDVQPRFVDMAHDVGLKVVAQWPEWKLLDLTSDAVMFRDFEGNISSMDILENRGPSYWMPDVLDKTIEQLSWLSSHVDGVLIVPRYSDSPFPVPWGNTVTDDYRNTARFWCFDQWGREAYGKPMPTHAEIGADGQVLTDTDFYRWYQQAWSDRMCDLSSAAIDHGLSEQYTWMVPLHCASLENMAAGTYNQAWVYDRWTELVRSRGGNPTVVACCLFGSWDASRATNVSRTLQMATEHGWNLMAGAEAVGSPEVLVQNVTRNTDFADRHGLSLIASGRHFFHPCIRMQMTAHFVGLKEG